MCLSGELGVASRLDVVARALGWLAGLDVLDIGCGESTLPRDLAALGASCTGIDPFMAARDWETAGPGRWRIVTASAEDLPLASGSIDGVLFVFSLHHVPVASMTLALAEARRVVKPGGFVYVAEPLAEGDFNELLSVFHDEREVRRQAQKALGAAVPLFSAHAAGTYVERRRFSDFDTFAALMRANTRFNSYTADDVVTPAVAARFASITQRTGGVFDQPVKVDVLT